MSDAPKKRVVIADDSGTPREILHRVLRNAGFEVVAIETNGSDAVKACRKLKPDLAVIDHSMPNGIQGAEAAAIIVAEKLAGAVVVASSASQDAIVQQLKNAGVGFIPKPYNKDEFLPKLHAFLASLPA